MSTDTRTGTAELDHAVVMVRDRMDEIAPRFVAKGFTLSDLATHNVGSHNRLIVLDSAYLELLGWLPGPTQPRKEIADSPFGLEALVLRTDDADVTFARLRDLGHSPNPVLDLSRPAQVQGRAVEARFRTVRFAEQPVAGMRMYFCEHLTPQYVWTPALMAHANGARTLRCIDATADDAPVVAERIAAVTGATSRPTAAGAEVVFANVTIRVRETPDARLPTLEGVVLASDDGTETAIDLRPGALTGHG